MTIVGFSLSKIALERTKKPLQKLELKTGIFINSITEEKSSDISKDKTLLNLAFTYFLEYSPGIAKIEFGGSLNYLTENKKAEEIIKEFSKTKKMDKEFQSAVYNFIFQRCNLKALILEEEAGLPLHIRMPRLNISDAKKN